MPGRLHVLASLELSGWRVVLVKLEAPRYRLDGTEVVPATLWLEVRSPAARRYVFELRCVASEVAP